MFVCVIGVGVCVCACGHQSHITAAWTDSMEDFCVSLCCVVDCPFV